nr:glycosyltransferase [Brevundimonas diminuta]
MSQKLLTVIIPIKTSHHYDMIERIRYRAMDVLCPESVCFMVVDDGSPDEDAASIKAICDELGYEYVSTERQGKQFCASSARNVGAIKARTKYIVHEDVDLFPYPGYYKDLIDEIKIQRLDDDNSRFLTVPALYLSDDLTHQALSGGVVKNEIIQKFLISDPDIKTYLPASSVIVVNRYYYLSIGGYDDRYNGWGLEDLDFAYRLTNSANQFIVPKNEQWLIEGGYSSFSVYEGWRSRFRLHGDMLARKGIFTLHAWHPADVAWRSPVLHGNNKRLFKGNVADFRENGHTLPPLSDAASGRSLIFGKGTFAFNRALLPLWGDLEVQGYEYFIENDIIEYVKNRFIDRIIFTNPYANASRLNVYNRVRDAGIPYYVVERGALNDAMFIDDTGFCCESSRYDEAFWPELTEDRRKIVENYISQETTTASALENQGRLVGARALRHSLGIGSKKVLFVPFQSRSDTTVNYFAGPIGSFDNFVELVRAVTRELSSDWVVLIKNHPLSDSRENIPGAIDVKDAHINDLLELSDHVLLMNSGVGVMSLLFGKPVMYASRAYYANKKLNNPVKTVEDVIGVLMSNFTVDDDSRYRFISYLIEDFYSFGKFTTEKREFEGRASLTITTNIDYYRVNVLGSRVMDVPSGERYENVKAPIYDIFREWILSHKYNERKRTSETQKKPIGSPPRVDDLLNARKAFASGDYIEAARLFDIVVERAPGVSKHLREAAEAYVHLGLSDEALNRLQRASKLAPNNKAIGRRIRELRLPKFLRFAERPYPVERA